MRWTARMLHLAENSLRLWHWQLEYFGPWWAVPSCLANLACEWTIRPEYRLLIELANQPFLGILLSRQCRLVQFDRIVDWTDLVTDFLQSHVLTTYRLVVTLVVNAALLRSVEAIDVEVSRWDRWFLTWIISLMHVIAWLYKLWFILINCHLFCWLQIGLFQFQL